MAKGSQNLSTWDHWVNRLRLAKCRFRIHKRKGKPFIFIKEMVDGKVAREFSSGIYEHKFEDHIEMCAKECLAAGKRGRWTLAAKRSSGLEGLTWPLVASNCLENLRARVARHGSRKNCEGHLKEIAQFSGAVSVEKLKEWALQRSPITEAAPYRNRLETLSHIDKAGDLDLKEVIVQLKALRPTGAAKKEQERATQKVRAIPEDKKLQAWLDKLEGHEQWVLALIATYGLRPSEAWHAEGIDDEGWIFIPGDGLTKTEEHEAPPILSEWVERYKLKENFELYQKQINNRWPIVWEDRKGQMIPTNNSVVSNALYRRIYEEKIPRLWVGDEWVRPYSLRHAYAIRCETSLDPDLLATPSEEFAKWLGHTIDVHKRTYLKWMSRERRSSSLKARVGVYKNQGASNTNGELPPDVMEKLARLEKIEKAMKGL